MLNRLPFLSKKNPCPIEFSENPYRHLLYSRGYILSEKRYPFKFLRWKHVQLPGYSLLFDPRLNFAQSQFGNSWTAVLGMVIDITNPDLPSAEITSRLLRLFQKSNDDFYQYLDVLSGRYIVIYGDGMNTWLVQDATGMRSAFYSRQLRIVASHSNLVKMCEEHAENEQIDLTWLTTYQSFYLPGNQTPYQDILYLTPNTRLDLNQMQVRRFFPREDHDSLRVGDILDEVSTALESQLVHLAKRQPLMFSLSAGSDSRATLALSKKVKDRSLYFTYFKSGDPARDHMNPAVLEVDRQVASEIARNLDLNHRILEINYDHGAPQQYAWLTQVQQENTFLHHNYLLSFLYYEQLPHDALHIRSTVTEVFKRFFRKSSIPAEDLTPEGMAFCYSRKAASDPMVIQAFDSFYRQVDFHQLKNYDPYDLFYWEYRLGIWHTSLLLESDIAHDTFVIYNSRAIIQKLLSLPESDQHQGTILNLLIQKHWKVLNYWGKNNTNTGDFSDPQFDSYGLKLDPFLIKGGSTLDPQRQVPVYTKAQENRTKFFIDLNDPHQGDYAEFSKEVSIEPGTWTALALLLRSPYENPRLKARLIYKVFVDELQIAEEDISDWKESNLIQVIWKPVQAQVKVSIRIEAVMDCEKYNWGRAGTILVERIQLEKITSGEAGSIRASSPFTRLLVDCLPIGEGS